MEVNFTQECQNAHSVVVVLPNGATINPQCESVNAVGLVEVPDLLEKGTCLNSETDMLNRTYRMMDSNLNIDIEKGTTEIPKSSEESIGCLKSDDSLAKALQKMIWLQLTGIFMHLFMQQSHDLPMVASKAYNDHKVITENSSFAVDRTLVERVYDTPTNRSRKFKRSPSFNSSFNSRRVVLLFSVVSSMGTIILIYLTLRVRQISDGSGTI